MTIDRYQVEIGGIPIDVIRKDIKNLHIGVYPPEGRVRVSAPSRLDTEAVRLAIVARLTWIRHRQAEFQGQVRQSKREMVTGESHYFQGRRYRLDVHKSKGRTGVQLRNNSMIELQVPPGSSRETREAILEKWYRERMREQVPALKAKWEERLGVQALEIRIKKMKTLWGSCNTHARRIWLNLELAKKPESCLEYILVHEMVHLIERNHTQRFRELMDSNLPHWRIARDQLNQAPLAHNDWSY